MPLCSPTAMSPYNNPRCEYSNARLECTQTSPRPIITDRICHDLNGNHLYNEKEADPNSVPGNPLIGKTFKLNIHINDVSVHGNKKKMDENS